MKTTIINNVTTIENKNAKSWVEGSRGNWTLSNTMKGTQGGYVERSIPTKAEALNLAKVWVESFPE